MAIDPNALIPELTSHLLEWLPRQPWFDATGDEISSISVIRLELIRSEWPLVMWAPFEVHIDGAPIIVQTVLAVAPEVPDAVPDNAIIGELTTSAGPVMAFDALGDPALATVFATHVAAGASPSTVKAMTHEPWGTTLELADQWELTIFRRVESGAHPDVELTRGLAEAGCSSVRPPAAVWRKNFYDLAVVRRSQRRAAPAETLFAESVQELLTRRCQPRESPLDVGATVTELGRALADIHVQSAATFGVTESTGDALIEQLTFRLPRHLGEASANRIAATYRRLAQADDLGLFIRVHGNLSPASVARSRQGWMFSRFGCDPESFAMYERVPSSPLSDVAGLLHGLGVIAKTALGDAVAANAGADAARDAVPDVELSVLAEAWEERAVDALVSGYTSNDAVHRLLPVERISRDALLALFELERSVRRMVRITRERSALLSIPVEDLERIDLTEVRARW